jgi:apolipoprotein N-acyltransferase
MADEMNFFLCVKSILPSPLSAILSVISAILLILAFPDFDLSILAWFALVPLLCAVGGEKESWGKSFVTGWIFGLIFFFGTCWWLTYAPINYAFLPALPVYFLLLCASAVVAVFPAVFTLACAILLKKYGNRAILFAPFLWIFTEFLRYWLTGNNWNAIAYSQAFNPILLGLAKVGGIYLPGFVLLLYNCFAFVFVTNLLNLQEKLLGDQYLKIRHLLFILFFTPLILLLGLSDIFTSKQLSKPVGETAIVAIQPNVPMSGLTYQKYEQLLERHIELAESELKKMPADRKLPITVIFPESPMMFQYGRDANLREFFKEFALRNNVSILINSAEMTPEESILNSAVMIDENGEKSNQYDKIYLVPFGEFIPLPEPFASQMPAFVGNFQPGNEYDLVSFGTVTGGIMICFESHFGDLSRQYVLRGADVLIEMTNDGYLGKTPVLRQHLANAVFRAAETNRPLLRVTNVGITAYINERGEISDAADVYTEATRNWTISKSDGAQTFYVRYGDWFAWLCSLVSLALLSLASLFKAKPRLLKNVKA